MPHQFHTLDGTPGKPGPKQPLLLTITDGTKVEAIWAGSAKEENLSWWRDQPGNGLGQTGEVSEIAIKAADTGETIWGAAPAGARLIFVLLALEPGKNCRLAKMVTTAATPEQAAYFRHGRFSLFGTLKPDGTIAKIPPLTPSPPAPPAQSELF